MYYFCGVGILKKLASQTLIYGLSSMLGRFINFLLVIPHTKYLNTVADYGDITTLFAFMAFINIILSYGMETSYFNFIRNGNDPEKVYSIIQKSLIGTTFLFAILVLSFPNTAADLIEFPGKTEYIYICLSFLVFDTLSILPFARLRYQEKPLKFAAVKLTNIGVNVALNLWLLTNPPIFLNGLSQVSLIMLANAVASLASFAVLSPLAFKIKGQFDGELYKKMLQYAWPLIFIGLAGMVNETLDRTMLKKLLPASEGSYQNGLYGAFYKLTMVMTMFVQAYRFAAEPFFFKQKEGDDARKTYALVMYWFTGVCTLIFLACMLFVDPLAHLFIKKVQFFENPKGLAIVPVLLLANLFLGIYYNLSVWYRLTDNTKKGAVISFIGAAITILLNLILIPIFGFTACAWITLLVYFLMCVMSYFWGQRYYKVPYTPIKYLVLIGVSIILWIISVQLNCQINVKWLEFLINILVISLMLLIIWLLQPKGKIP